MRRFAIDAGPLVALLNARDEYHKWSTEVLDTVEPPLVTCESVISEACFLVRHLKGGSDAVFGLMSRGIVKIDFDLGSEAPHVRRLMARYSNVPMALADACLVRMSEIEGQLTIITIDSDFRIYRRNGRQVVPVVMPAGA
jgi:predicted nucleic acid-binding protein